MNRKTVALLSGGLDSILAAKLMIEQGIEVEAVNYHIAFAACGGNPEEGAAAKAAKTLNIPLKIFDITEEYLETFENPKHGYGANINPCIDCKIFMLKKAKEYMEEIGASFLVTGEVLGERPMSQRRDALNIIERDAGVKGILLRPLSAKLLKPTIPEEKGLVDRNKLLDIRGRGRRPQMELAKKFGIKEYPSPAGGCLLTDAGFTRRVRDIMKHGELSVNNLKILTVGRHFRLSKHSKLVVGRDKEENEILESLVKREDILFKLKDHEGPFSVLRGEVSEGLINLAAGIAAYHTRFKKEGSLRLDYWKTGDGGKKTISIEPESKETVEKLRI